MNKKLMLIRHGQANSGKYENSDFDRTLSPTGIEEAQELAFRLKNKLLIPTHLLSSTAVRALSTATIFAGIWGMEFEDIQMNDTIYDSSVHTYLQAINGLDDNMDFVALFGHNPEISEFAEYLTYADFSQMPTCGVVIIDFAFDSWDMVKVDSGIISLFDYPGADTAL